jgi:hypothetical protein
MPAGAKTIQSATIWVLKIASLLATMKRDSSAYKKITDQKLGVFESLNNIFWVAPLSNRLIVKILFLCVVLSFIADYSRGFHY